MRQSLKDIEQALDGCDARSISHSSELAEVVRKLIHMLDRVLPLDAEPGVTERTTDLERQV
jgi:hypothetical protein